MNFPRVLEVGAGEGAILLHLDAWPQKRELYAVEISNSGVSMIQSRKLPPVVEAKHFDGYHVPYPDKFVDLAILSHVLEHVEYPHTPTLLRFLLRSEGFTILHEPLTRATLDVQEYSYFENSHRRRTLPALAVRRLRYALATLRLRLAPSGVRDSMASACMVLCRPDSELRVFG
jgi:hypothetical protein